MYAHNKLYGFPSRTSSQPKTGNSKTELLSGLYNFYKFVNEKMPNMAADKLLPLVNVASLVISQMLTDEPLNPDTVNALAGNPACVFGACGAQ